MAHPEETARPECREILRALMSLLYALRWGIAFSLTILVLPLSAYPGVPGHDLLGGVFTDLAWWELLAGGTVFVGASLSVMFTMGLIVDGIEDRRRARGGSLEDALPAWAERFFGVPVTKGQLALFLCGVPAPGLAVMAWHSEPGPAAGLALAALAVLAAYLLALLIGAPARVMVENRVAPPEPFLAPLVWGAVERIRPVLVLAGWLRRAASFVLRRLTSDVVDDRGLLKPDHFAALTTLLGTLALLLVAYTFFPPPGPRQLPAVALLFALVMLLVWAFGAIEFQLARYRIPPLAVLLVLVVASYKCSGDVHSGGSCGGGGGGPPSTLAGSGSPAPRIQRGFRPPAYRSGRLSAFSVRIRSRIHLRTSSPDFVLFDLAIRFTLWISSGLSRTVNRLSFVLANGDSATSSSSSSKSMRS
jgi:hypothetical protein